MRKISLLAVVFILCMALCSGNLYAACNVTRGKIEVSQGTGSSCSSIQSAINAADGINPIIISVLPGTYPEQIIMKPKIAIVGSGSENTKITSSANATVIGAMNSSIENLWVENSNGVGQNPTGILVDSASMNIRNVKVNVFNDVGSDAIGIISTNGSIANVSNCDMYVEDKASGTGSWIVGILALYGVAGSDITIRDSVINSKGGAWNYGIEVYDSYASVKIRDSRVEAVGNSNTRENIAAHNRNLAVSNSSLLATGTSMAMCGVSGNNTVKIGGSLIQGGICNTPKVVNSWDENFNPLLNR